MTTTLEGGKSMTETVSDRPWSDYTAADYTPEQWHVACLIHQHEGAPTSKSQCKLPVRTPSGTLNRNGVHAAAAALAGARGGVNANPEDKVKAAKSLVRLYGELDEEPPESLKHTWTDSFFAHYGIKGMRWGVRRSQAQLDSGSVSEDAKRASEIKAKVKTSGTSSLSNKEMQELVTRLNLEQQYSRLTSKLTKRSEGLKFVKNLLDVGTTANNVVAFARSPVGKKLAKALAVSTPVKNK